MLESSNTMNVSDITEIEAWLEKTINLLLDAPEDRAIDKNQSLFMLGMDSVTTIQLQGAIEDTFTEVSDINVEAFMEEPTIKKLAETILKK